MAPQEITAHLKNLGDQEIESHALRYFKGDPGGYGHGDHFLGNRRQPMDGHRRTGVARQAGLPEVAR